MNSVISLLSLAGRDDSSVDFYFVRWLIMYSKSMYITNPCDLIWKLSTVHVHFRPVFEAIAMLVWVLPTC